MSGYLKTSCQGCEKALFNCHTSSVNQPFLWQKASRPWCPWKSAMRVWLVPHCCDFLKTFLWETLRVFSFLVLQTSSNEQSLILLPGTTWVVLSSCKSGMSKLQSALQLQGPARNWLFFDRSDCCHLDILCRLRALQVIQAGLWVSWPRFLPQKTDTLETWDAFWMDFGLSKRTVSFFGATLKSSIVLVSTFFPCAHEFSLSSSPVGHVGFLVLKPEERSEDPFKTLIPGKKTWCCDHFKTGCAEDPRFLSVASDFFADFFLQGWQGWHDGYCQNEQLQATCQQQLFLLLALPDLVFATPLARNARIRNCCRSQQNCMIARHLAEGLGTSFDGTRKHRSENIFLFSRYMISETFCRWKWWKFQFGSKDICVSFCVQRYITKKPCLQYLWRGSQMRLPRACHLQIHSLWPMDHWLKLPAKLAANIRPLRSMQLLGGQIFKRRILMMLLHGWNFEIFESWGFARPGVVIMSKLAAPLRVLQWSNMTVQLATSIGKGTCVSVRVVKLSWDLGHFVRWNLKFERLQDSTCEPDQFERFVRGWSSMKKAWWLGKHPQVNCVGLLRAAS